MKIRNLLKNSVIFSFAIIAVFMLWSQKASARSLLASGWCNANSTGSDISYCVYQENDGQYTLELSGYGKTKDYDVANNTFAPWTFYKSNITKVYIDNRITYLGNALFYDLRNLESIEIPFGTTYIANDTFHGCDNLTNIVLPTSLKNSSQSPFGANPGCFTFVAAKDDFSGTDSRVTYTLLENKDASGNFNNTYTLNFTGNGYMKDCDSIYGGTPTAPWKDYLSKITTVNIGEGILNIGSAAFYKCSGLTSVSLPETLITINESAFESCTNYVGPLTIPDSVTTIRGFAFAYCYKLSSVKLPASLAQTGRLSFAHCKEIKSIEIPGKLNEIGSSCFKECQKLETVILSDNTKIIDEGAFEDCKKLKEVKNSKVLTAIGRSAFYNCEVLDTIDISNVTQIGSYAFSNCHALLSISLNPNLIEIGENTFEYCSSLTSVELPEGLTKLPYCLFYNCTALASIKIPASVTAIDYAALAGTAITSFTLPENVTAIETSAFSSSLIQSFKFNEKITSIPDGAFESCIYLKSIEIPETITSIGFQAFRKCESLTTLTIPGSVTAIGDEVFDEDSALETVYLPESFKSQVDSFKPAETTKFVFTHIKKKVSDSKYLKTPASCTAEAVWYYHCTYCNKIIDETYTTPALGHTGAKEYVQRKATFKKDGVKVDKCSRCNEVINEYPIPKAYITVADTVKLNAKGSKAKVTVLTADGTKISSKSYSLKYSNNKKVGKAKVKVSLMGDYYTGSATKTFTVAKANEIPSKAVITSSKVKGKKLTLKWKKAKSPATGIEIQYSTNKNFLTNVKSVKINNLSTTSKTISKLKADNYNIRIREFNKVGKYTAYGSWSKVKSFEVK